MFVCVCVWFIKSKSKTRRGGWKRPVGPPVLCARELLDNSFTLGTVLRTTHNQRNILSLWGRRDIYTHTHEGFILVCMCVFVHFALHYTIRRVLRRQSQRDESELVTTHTTTMNEFWPPLLLFYFSVWVAHCVWRNSNTHFHLLLFAGRAPALQNHQFMRSRKRKRKPAVPCCCCCPLLWDCVLARTQKNSWVVATCSSYH